ncbi:unnamed protein product [Linum tenue]|uniref:Uncharacterized protein n=1 Tax=Linum tenue TaxID=586396 RepID=A0AAV0PF37_9ROSI|nr:unnamed protein product [Linum tenue]
MAVFTLNSDNQFITPSLDLQGHVTVMEYSVDPYAFDRIRPAPLPGHCALRAVVGPRRPYKKLQVVAGVTFENQKLADLANDLSFKAADGGTILHRLSVNRFGMCFFTDVDHAAFGKLAMNDYFGWSKYGVVVPRDVVASVSNVRNRYELYGGAVVIDVRGAMRCAEEGEELRRRLEERRKEVVRRNEEVESRWREFVGEKEREAEVVRDRVVAFKAAVGALVGDHHGGEE